MHWTLVRIYYYYFSLLLTGEAAPEHLYARTLLADRGRAGWAGGPLHRVGRRGEHTRT